MAQRQEKNVKYFPHFVNHRKTLIILEDAYRDGYKMWFKTLEQLAQNDNHYIDLRDEIDFLFLASKFREEQETLEEFYNLCAKLKAIDQDLWKQKIIWSENFTANVHDAYKRRANQPPTKEEICDELEIKCATSSTKRKTPAAPKVYFLQFAHLKITEPEHNKLVEKYGADEVEDIYGQIKNYRKNTKYKSLYLTAGTWLKKRADDPAPGGAALTANEQLMRKLKGES